jgi:hypothetical protein
MPKGQQPFHFWPNKSLLDTTLLASVYTRRDLRQVRAAVKA